MHRYRSPEKISGRLSQNSRTAHAREEHASPLDSNRHCATEQLAGWDDTHDGSENKLNTLTHLSTNLRKYEKMQRQTQQLSVRQSQHTRPTSSALERKRHERMSSSLAQENRPKTPVFLKRSESPVCSISRPVITNSATIYPDNVLSHSKTVFMAAELPRGWIYFNNQKASKQQRLSRVCQSYKELSRKKREIDQALNSYNSRMFPCRMKKVRKLVMKTISNMAHIARKQVFTQATKKDCSDDEFADTRLFRHS